MSSSRTRQRRLKRPHCFMCETVLSDGSSSSAASTQRRQRQRRTETVHVPTAPSVPSITSTAASSTTIPVGSSSTSSSSASLPLHSPTSIQRPWQRRRSATVLAPTPSSPPSSIVTQPIVPSGGSGPSSLPSSSTMTSADVGSSSSTMLALASAPSRPSSLAPSAATPVNVPSEPSFQDPALADRYRNYDHQKVSLSDAVAAERAFAAAPAFVKRRLGSGEQPPWFWAQNSAKYFTLIKGEDMEEEKSVCAVCIEEYKEFQPCYILLCCFHFFHCRCLLGWWIHCSLQGKERTCPLCCSIVPDSPPISSPCENAAQVKMIL